MLAPYICATIFKGALPGRKPSIRTRFCAFFNSLSVASLIANQGRETMTLRSKFSNFSIVALMRGLSFVIKSVQN